MTSTDSWDAVDVHPICYFDLDIFPAFPKGHEKLQILDLGRVPLCVDQI